MSFGYAPPNLDCGPAVGLTTLHTPRLTGFQALIVGESVSLEGHPIDSQRMHGNRTHATGDCAHSSCYSSNSCSSIEAESAAIQSEYSRTDVPRLSRRRALINSSRAWTLQAGRSSSDHTPTRHRWEVNLSGSGIVKAKDCPGCSCPPRDEPRNGLSGSERVSREYSA
jgi:hypothetical protein